jgi:hypothetical protein
MIKHKTDANKVLHAWKLFPRTFTFGEHSFTLVKGTWDDDELVGAIYTDQNGHEWLVYNDTGIEAIEDTVRRNVAVLGSRGEELLAALKAIMPYAVAVPSGILFNAQKAIAQIEKELA